jgi:hypothetical protein
MPNNHRFLSRTVPSCALPREALPEDRAAGSAVRYVMAAAPRRGCDAVPTGQNFTRMPAL